MDPLSATVGVLSTVDICARTVKFLRNIQKGASTVDQDLETLRKDVEAVESTIDVLDSLCKAVSSREGGKKLLSTGPTALAWQRLVDLLPKCGKLIEELQRLFEEIDRVPVRKSAQRFESHIKSFRKRSREGEYLRLRSELQSYVATLHMLLAALQASCSWDPESSSDSKATKQHRYEYLRLSIEQFQPLLEAGPGVNLRDSFDAANAVASLASNNKYFDPPEAVSSIYTGRRDLLDILAGHMFDPPTYSKDASENIGQKRFIIYGLGGAGKTQFCCKFAEDNKFKYWGVFWIDGSSEERAKETYCKIAIMAGADPNDHAARSLLSVQVEPWLLIIDNMNDDRFPLERYLPSGKHGQILITTQNPSFKVHGTVGDRFFDFSEWHGDAAAELLLKAANQTLPWSESVRETALNVSRTLGYLPLALIVAGKTILKGLCTLQNYLIFYKDSWQRARQRTRSQVGAALTHVSDDSQMKIYRTCDVMYLSLTSEASKAAQDAVDLLNVLSFLHRQNIRVDLLVQGAKNPEIERAEADKESKASQKLATWRDLLEKYRLLFYDKILAGQDAAHLPQVLRLHGHSGDCFDEYRLREALVALSQRSLVMYNPNKDTYSVHPIIHTWVRERPEMGLGSQAVWCEAAATLVAQSILLPPLASSEADEDFRRDLLPHLNQIKKCRDDLHRQYEKNQQERGFLFPVPKPSLNRRQALSLAKHSLVYGQCGQFEEAHRLQVTVYDFLRSKMGLQNPKTVRIQLALAHILWRLGRGTEAADLQETALNTCLHLLGPKDRMTLTVMDSLGVSRWMQGRYTEAQKLHETAVELLEEVAGFDNEDTLRAKDHLGCVHSKYWRHEKARRFHQIASKGLEKALGPSHPDTMTAMENLAMTYFALGQQDMPLARSIMEEVVERRRHKLGREHPYTLLGILHLARVKAAQGELEEARNDINHGLLVGYRNLGANHMGVLYARMYLGETLLKMELWREAEDELNDVIERQRKLPSAQSGIHPDALMAMYILAECMGAQNRFGDGIALCHEAVIGLDKIGGQVHPFRTLILERERRLSEQLRMRNPTEARALLIE